MRFTIIFLSLGVVAWSSASRGANGPALPSDQDRLQGWWVCYAVSLDGKPLPDQPGNTPFQISGNQVKSVQKGAKSKDSLSELSFTIDPTQDPKTIDVHWLDANKKTTWKGIYALEKDEVKLALLAKIKGLLSWERGSERPTSFTVKPPKDAYVVVFVFRRAKAPPAVTENDKKGKPAATENNEMEPPPSIAFNGFGAVALSPDGKWIAAAGAPGTTVRLWDIATGKEIAVLSGHKSEVIKIVFSQDGKRLFTATPTEVRTWELPKGKHLQRIPAGPGQTDQFTLSGDDRWFVSDPDLNPEIAPDGKFVVSKIRLWDLEKGKEARSFKLFQTTLGLVGEYIDLFAEGKGSDAIIATALSHDGKWVAAGTEHGDVHLWETDTGKKVRTFGRYKDFGAAPIGFSKDGKWLVTNVFQWTTMHGKTEPRGSVLLWNMATGKVEHEIHGKLFFRSLTADGKWFLTGQDERTVRIWDVETGKEVRSFTGGNDPVMDCFVSRDKKLLTTYDQSGTVRLWEVATGKELRTVKVRTPADRGWPCANFKVRVSGDAKLLVAWTPARLTLWNLENGKLIRSLERKVDD